MAKSKTERRRIAEPDLREVIALHTKASKQLTQSLGEHQALLTAGKKVAARVALRRAEKLQTVTRALEAQVRQPANA
jgi:hypothetical protein